jgi:predicted nucleic acid-binding protein
VLGSLLWTGAVCEIIWVARGDIEAAWEVFEAFDDKTWSFTDCVSYAVMKRLGINEAFALDDDFRQFGFVVVKP